MCGAGEETATCDGGREGAFTDLLVKQPRRLADGHKREAVGNRGPALPGLTRVRDWAEVLLRLATISGTVPI